MRTRELASLYRRAVKSGVKTHEFTCESGASGILRFWVSDQPISPAFAADILRGCIVRHLAKRDAWSFGDNLRYLVSTAEDAAR